LPQFGDFVLQQQFASLEFMQFELVYGWMELFLLDLPLKRHVTAFEFGEMALQGHAQLLSMLERQDCDTISVARKWNSGGGIVVFKGSPSALQHSAAESFS
jgi:hypothetical protein